MTTIAVAVTAGLVVAIAGLLAAYLRLGRNKDEQPRSPPELQEQLRRAQDELERMRQLAMLSSTLDLDELLSRVLQAVASLADADAAALALSQEEPPIVKTMSLSAEEVVPLAGDWQGQPRARGVTIRYRFPGLEAALGANAIHLGVLLPLRGLDDSLLGSIAVFWRRHREDPTEAELAALEELAAHAGQAIENARQVRNLRELVDRDPLSGLHNRRYFHESLGQEVARAHRYDRSVALILFDLDDFGAVNERIGHLGGDAVLAEVAARLGSVVRTADIPCRVGGDEFGVILPESTLGDADSLFTRLQMAVHGQQVGRVHEVQISAGMAELGRADDATSFFRRADEALFRAKRLGKGKVVAAEDTEAY